MAHSEQSRAFSHLVVVDSSAGGIEALSRLLGSLPEDFPAPVVIAQHMHPERESHLEEILARHSSLPVKTVAEAAPLEAGTVFVVPADRHLNITDKEIEVHEDGRGRPKPSIDLLMSSAAEIYGESLIAVILSGSGSDGTDGARAVKRAGGTVVIQDPESAEFSSMPSSLAPSTVDIVRELDGIGTVLSELLSEESESRHENEDAELAEFLEALKQQRGIDFSEYKRPTIRRRLARRFAATGVRELGRYRRYLEQNPEEYAKLINTFLIKVTEFFRNPGQFEYLREEILPRLIERARDSGEQLRVWSAGCATGEEAYSLAIAVCDAISENVDEDASRPNVRIFATDLDEGAVEHARRGVYPASALSALSEEQRSRYFEEADGLYYIKQPIRSMIIFGEHDLAQRSPFPRLDLVVSRNVLIYFTPELQRHTLKLFAFSLKDEGYLMLGASEGTSSLSEYFALLERQNSVFRRQGERFVMPASEIAGQTPSAPPAPAHGQRSLGASQPYYQLHGPAQEHASESEEAVLDRLPAGVMSVDRNYDIQTINAAARRLLSIHSEAVGEDLLHLLRDVSYDDLRSALDFAFRQARSAPTGEFDVQEVTTAQSRTLRMVCHPVLETDDRGSPESESPRSVTILVEDVSDYSRQSRELEEYRRKAVEDYESLRREYEENAASQSQQNARLVEANGQLEAANRKLRRKVEQIDSSNEQYQLYAEEAKASAEEVETLNEELQATNEELETVNEELQATVEELNATNDDLQRYSNELQELSRARESEQQRMQRQLQNQLQTLLESIPEPMLVVEPSGQAIVANDSYHQIFPGGCVAMDEAGAELAQEQTPQGRASRGEAFTMEFITVSNKGVRKRYEARGTSVGDEHQRGSLVVFREISGGAAREE